MESFFALEWSEALWVLAKLALSFVLVMPVAWEREERTRLLGLRTFPIVAMASCAYVLTSTQFAAGNEEAQARIIQGLITGMGFIGGGAILKGEGGVRGTATASSLWATGAIGASVAFGRMEIAITLSAVLFLTLRFLTPLERDMGGPDARIEGGEGESEEGADDRGRERS